MQEATTPAATFLSALAGPDAQFTFQTFADKTAEKGRGNARVIHGTFSECEPLLRSLNEQRHGIFFTVQETDGRGRKTENIVAARSLYVDQDTPGRTCPLSVPLPPSARVLTSCGKEHIYWFLQPGEPLGHVKSALQTLAGELGTDPSVAKLPGVLRLPGFWHCKADPFLSELLELHPERRYTIAEVVASTSRPVRGHLQTYAMWQYARALERLRATSEGERNNAIHRTSWFAKEIIKDGYISEAQVIEDILNISSALPGREKIPTQEALAAIRSGLSSTVASDRYQEAKMAVVAHAASGPPTLPTGSEDPGGPPTLPTGRVFSSGLEADLAGCLLHDCGAEQGLVQSLGSELWAYSPSTGVWDILDMDRLKSWVQTYHGCWVYPADGRVSRLAITPKKRDAVIDLALYSQSVLSPRFFDSAPVGVQFADGWASVREGALVHEPNAPEHRCRTLLDYPLLSGPEPVRWLDFLSELFPGEPPLHSILQEAIGAAMFGLAPSFAKCLVLLGSGSNGKSVLLSALARYLFPARTLSHVPPGRWDQEYYAYSLRHSLINLVGELPAWKLVNTDIFKSIIAGDPVMGRAPYGRPVSFQPRALHVFACNELPATRDYTHGFWRRFLLLPFTAQFDGSQKPEQVLARFSHERSGIARWALAGAQRLLTRGCYTSTAGQQQAEQSWRMEADPVLGFRAACCIEGATPAADLYRHFRLWCESTGRFPASGAKFGRRLRELGIEKTRKASGWLYAVGLKPVQEWGFEA